MKKVLVIEDNPDMLDNISEILELANYEVIRAHNGKEGVRQAQQNIPDLILCDIMMPELDGFGVLKIISEKEELNHIPFVFMSAKSEKSDFREGMRLGADDYLTKPFEDVQLLETIEMRLKKSGGKHSSESDISKLHVTSIDSLYNKNKAKEDFKALFAQRPLEEFKRKDSLFSKGHHPRYLYFVQTGMVKTSMFNEDGKEFVSGLYGDKQVVGLIDLFGGETYSETAKFVSDGTCKSIAKEDFLKAIYGNKDLAMYIYTKLHFSVSIRKDRLLHLAYDSVRKRTADCLLWLNDLYNTSNVFPFTIAFAREDLAAMVGTAKESLIRTLSAFKDEGLIDTNTSEITLYSKEKLEDLIA
jgi:DNA-binding response OmpR family regulator